MGQRHAFPSAAVAAIKADWAGHAPALLEFLDRAARGQELGETESDALFLIVHLCAERREPRACGPLLRLLAGAAERVEDLLGDALTETLKRVVASVFDGDFAALQAVILNQAANEYARESLLYALVPLVGDGRIDRQAAAEFLARCDAELQPREDSIIWVGWQEAIAHLGLADLRPLVVRAFADGRIHDYVMELKHFDADLDAGLESGDAPGGEDWRFGDVEAELAGWTQYQPAKPAGPSPASSWGDPVRNPFREVGRNDPCPCGSGKKFKKCCLGKAPFQLG